MKKAAILSILFHIIVAILIIIEIENPFSSKKPDTPPLILDFQMVGDRSMARKLSAIAEKKADSTKEQKTIKETLTTPPLDQEKQEEPKPKPLVKAKEKEKVKDIPKPEEKPTKKKLDTKKEDSIALKAAKKRKKKNPPLHQSKILKKMQNSLIYNPIRKKLIKKRLWINGRSRQKKRWMIS